MINTYRSPTITPDILNDAQREIYERIAAPRKGEVSGPYNMWVWKPELCTIIYDMLECMERFQIDKRVREIIVLTVGRMLNSQHVWSSHVAKALASGIPEATMDALNNRKEVVFEERKDQLAYEIAVILTKGELLPQDLYDEAMDVFGLQQLVELSTYVGHYLMIGAILNTFDVRCSEKDNKLKLD